MRNTQKQIKETLSKYENGNTMERSKAILRMEINSVDWLTHQQSTISQQSAEIDSQSKQLELAVKALELIANGNNNFPTLEDTVDVLKDVRLVAKETISAIASLSEGS